MNPNDYVTLLQAHIIGLLVFLIGASAVVQHPEWFN
jgi:hypothetical protein